MILISILSIFHSFRAISYLALPMVYISQLIRYARCCSHYDDFQYHHNFLFDRLLSQNYEMKRLRTSCKIFYGRYPDLIRKYPRSMKDVMDDSFPDSVFLFFLINLFYDDFVASIVTFYLLALVSCIRQTMLTQSEAPGCVISWSDFS